MKALFIKAINDIRDWFTDGIIQDAVRAWTSLSPGTRKMIRSVALLLLAYIFFVWFFGYSNIYFINE